MGWTWVYVFFSSISALENFSFFLIFCLSQCQLLVGKLEKNKMFSVLDWSGGKRAGLDGSESGKETHFTAPAGN
jgi:hypothetical protein